MRRYTWQSGLGQATHVVADRVEFTSTHVVFWAQDRDRDRIVLAVRESSVHDLREVTS